MKEIYKEANCHNSGDRMFYVINTAQPRGQRISKKPTETMLAEYILIIVSALLPGCAYITPSPRHLHINI